jgi:hypothetical protein
LSNEPLRGFGSAEPCATGLLPVVVRVQVQACRRRAFRRVCPSPLRQHL